MIAACERLPVELNIFKMLANAESLFRPFLGLGTAILGSMKLSPRTRELVILHVGRMSRGEYEWVQHVPIGEAVGVTAEQIAALERGDITNLYGTILSTGRADIDINFIRRGQLVEIL